MRSAAHPHMRPHLELQPRQLIEPHDAAVGGGREVGEHVADAGGAGEEECLFVGGSGGVSRSAGAQPSASSVPLPSPSLCSPCTPRLSHSPEHRGNRVAQQATEAADVDERGGHWNDPAAAAVLQHAWGAHQEGEGGDVR